MNPTPSFAVLLQRFFTQRLMQQRQASAHTVSSYRDTFRLLLRFIQERSHKLPTQITFEELDAPLISAFLDDLEEHRGLKARSRNVRLATIRSFFNFAALERPDRSGQIQRVLAMPSKKFTRTVVGYLTRLEIDALLSMPDQRTWSGRRDHALILTAVQTGARLSEITALTRQSVSLDAGAHIQIIGKGRKERCTPLTKHNAAVLRSWMKNPVRSEVGILFPNAQGGRLSADGLQYILAKHVAAARKVCSSLKHKRVTPHMLRHTTAMELLQAGVDITVIALWLGHESLDTTRVYLDADLELKAKILSKTTPHAGRQRSYRPDDQLMSFLDAL